MRTLKDRIKDTVPNSVTNIQEVESADDGTDFILISEDGSQLKLRLFEQIVDGERVLIARYWSGYCWDYWDTVPRF